MEITPPWMSDVLYGGSKADRAFLNDHMTTGTMKGFFATGLFFNGPAAGVARFHARR